MKSRSAKLDCHDTARRSLRRSSNKDCDLVNLLEVHRIPIMPESEWRVDRKQKPQTLTGRPILPLRFILDQLQHRKSSLSARRVPDPHSGVDTILEQGGGTLARNGAVETVSGATAIDACTGEEKPERRVPLPKFLPRRTERTSTFY
jgi:hypothetical protein